MRGLSAVFLALAVGIALPAHSQRQGTQGGYSGHGGGAAHFGGSARSGSVPGRGFAGHPGAPSYSGLTGLQSPSSFSAPGRLPMPGRLQPPPRAGAGSYFGPGLRNSSSRPGYYGGWYGSGYGDGHAGGSHRGPYRGHDRDRRHERHERRGFYGYGYAYSPGYVYPYPLVIDPGFYDWGPTDYSEDQQGENAARRPPYPGPEYAGEPTDQDNLGEPYSPQQENTLASSGSIQPQRQEYHFAPQSTAPAKAQPSLKVIFKNDRSPVTMQNYMLNASSLTDLDADHFEKIPIDQVDIAATQEANRSRGIDFQVPIASRD